MSLNSIGCVTVQKLTNKCPPVATYFSDFGATYAPPPPLPEYDTNTFILCAPNGDRVRVVHKWLETNTSGVPDVTLMTNLVTGAAYAGATSTLVQCADVDQESDGEPWCVAGVNYTRYQLMSNGVPVTPAVVYWTNNNTGATVTVMPAGATKGVCVAAAPQSTVTGTALAQIAGANLSATNPNFAGQPDVIDTGVIGGNLISVTVAARGVVDGVSSPDRVEVDMPDGTVAYLLNGEVKEFNLSRGQEVALRREYRIRAIGNAYANIHGTFE